MVVGRIVEVLGRLGICGLYSEDNGKPWRVWGQGRVRIRFYSLKNPLGLSCVVGGRGKRYSHCGKLALTKHEHMSNL